MQGNINVDSLQSIDRKIDTSFLKGSVINYKEKRQIDRKDTVLSGENEDEVNSPYPIHPPTGERTRKTYDFTSKDVIIKIPFV